MDEKNSCELATSSSPKLASATSRRRVHAPVCFTDGVVAIAGVEMNVACGERHVASAVWVGSTCECSGVLESNCVRLVEDIFDLKYFPFGSKSRWIRLGGELLALRLMEVREEAGWVLRGAE